MDYSSEHVVIKLLKVKSQAWAKAENVSMLKVDPRLMQFTNSSDMLHTILLVMMNSMINRLAYCLHLIWCYDTFPFMHLSKLQTRIILALIFTIRAFVFCLLAGKLLKTQKLSLFPISANILGLIHFLHLNIDGCQLHQSFAGADIKDSLN